MEDLARFIQGMPKAELHMHLEGSVEPEVMIAMAQRNGVDFPFKTADALRAAFDFDDLQSFLDLLYAGNEVLRTEQDFFDMTWRYLERAHADHVLRAEVFLTPQAHTRRGISFDVVMAGVLRGLDQARRRLGISTDLIIGFQRHRSEQEGFEILEMAKPYRDKILGIGLGGAEAGNPPSKFRQLFDACRPLGWRIVAHAGEEGPAQYVNEALDVLKVERLDHGVRCEESPALVRRLAESRIPLTVCPLSNVKLRVFPTLGSHNLKRLLHAGLCVTVNSDDPTQFGGYVNDNLMQCQRVLGLSKANVVELAANSFRSAFLPDDRKKDYLARLDSYVENFR